MLKKYAIKYFKTTRLTAEAIGITYQAVYQWPDVLSNQVSDRVEAAMIRDRVKREALRKKITYF